MASCRGALAFAAGCAVGLGAALLAEERQARTFVLKIDDREHEITTGQEVSVPCGHAEGRVHRLAAAESAVQRFGRPGLRFAYPSSCTLTWDAEGEELGVRLRHPGGPILKLNVTGREIDIRDALERHASTMKSHLIQGGAAEVKVTEVVASIGGTMTAGRQVSCELLGEPRATEMYYVFRTGRTYSITLDYPLESAAQAQELWGEVAASLRFE